MSHWKDLLHVTGHRAEEQFDRLKHVLEERLGRERAAQIVAYHGYGNHSRLDVVGRLLRDKGISAASDRDTVWDNLLRMYQRMQSDELPGLPVTASFQGRDVTAISDEEGYFRLSLPGTDLLDQPPWVAVPLRVSTKDGEIIEATAQVLVPPEDSAFGVISDIDDTIMQTGAASLLDMARNTFLQNAQTRLSFPGVQAFYTALQRGPAGRSVNPIFYVSNGPWNLFDFLIDFMKLNGLPQGPVLLRDYGLDAEKFIKDDRHKTNTISAILETYPDLPFVLIGDSGEKDPEIYRRIVQDYPGRIRAVYIRDVTAEPRDSQVAEIAAEVSSEKDPEMLLLQDMGGAAEHAARLGLIDEGAVVAIQQAGGKPVTEEAVS